MRLESVARLKALNLGHGMAAALTARLLADAGATVVRPAADGTDPFDAVYPAYPAWREGVDEIAPADIEALLAEADICIVGGEPHPGLAPGPDAREIAARHPRLIVLELAAYAPGVPEGPAVDMLVQARSGLAWEQLPDQPVRFAVQLPTYGAVLMGQVGLWTALIDRERTGRGRIVRASLQQGAALFWSQIWMDADRADAAFDKLPPKGVNHLIFECADDGDWIHFVLGVPGALATVYRILEIDEVVDPNERGIPTLARGPKSYFADAALLAPAIRRFRRDDLLAAFIAAGIPAEAVSRPGESWADPQVEASGVIVDRPGGGRRAGAPLVAASHAGDADAPTAPAGRGADPLGGLRVVDLGNFIAGPFASKHLADYGADVIKVEPPSGLANLTGLRNTWVSNRGKRSICIDAKSPDGLAIMRRLCARADAVHHNFRLGVAERMGMDPAALRALNPGVVVLQTRAYGSHGPKASRPGFDMIMQALSGHEVRAGGEGNPPMWYRSAFVDFATGTLGGVAMLMGLYERARTGRVADVEVSLLATSLFLMSELVETPDGQFEGAPVLNAARTGFHPAEQFYATSDEWIAVCARTEDQAAAFAAALGLARHLGPRADWGEAEADLISAVLAQRPAADWIARLRAAGVWVEPCVRDGWAALRDDPAARAAGLVVQAPDPIYGAVTSTFGVLVGLDGWTPSDIRSAPVSGEHTREILAELGYGSDDIDDLYQRKVVA